MLLDWLRGIRKHFVSACVVLAAAAGTSRADDNTEELRKLLEQQSKQIQELKQRLDNAEQQKVSEGDADEADGAPETGGASKAPTAKLDDGAVRRIVADYLRDNPGAGMPPSVQTGFWNGQGFVIRSTQNPKYIPWADECKIPFELRIRGRIQLDYYNYNPTDRVNHQTGVNASAADPAGLVRPPGTESDLLVKRARFTMLGTVFSPNLRYYLEMDGNTRGINNTTNSAFNAIPSGQPNTGGLGNANGVVDNAVRLFSAYVAYDWRPCCFWKGCGEDCCEGQTKYAPTVTFIFGKFKPYFSFEEYVGSGNQQFVEYAMSEWFFDADDDNLLMQAGIQVKALDDRLFLHATVTNGNETQFPARDLDPLPGVNVGFWYDFGGNWNPERKAYDLWGDCISDIDYSCKPVVRVGAMTNFVPMDRRGIYGNAEQNRVLATQPAPGGTTFINTFNPIAAAFGNISVANGPAFAMDKFDSFTYESYVTGKWRGFSFLADGWVRYLNDFVAPKSNLNPSGAIIYQVATYNTATGAGVPASTGLNSTFLFPRKTIFDKGMVLQGGYFLIPKKLEVVGRWSWISGESGDIFGSGGVAKTTVIPSNTIVNGQVAPGTVAIATLNNAFHNYHEAQEYAMGVNYFFKRQLVKWQADVSYYKGGNPAANGFTPAGFEPGVDGWQFRTQVQLGW